MLALLGGLLFTVGIFHTIVTWTVDGWTVAAAVGVWFVFRASCRVESTPARPRDESDLDHMGVQ